MANTRPGFVIFLIAFATAQLLITRNLPAEEVEPAAKESCVTAKCHPSMGKGLFVHGPVAVGECILCHKKLDGTHKFQPIAEADGQCDDCHEKVNTMDVVHAPVKQGKCTKCHDPHQSSFKYQLRAEGADLCFLCHNKSIAGGKLLHGPVGVGACNACHTVHQSAYPKLLLAEGNAVCFTCHADKAEAFKSKKFMHSPVRKSCVSCHSPHSSNHRYTLKAEGSKDLCYTCHADKAKEIGEATVPHKGLDTERKCLGCHDPHVSDFPKQLLQQPMDLCLTCHDREHNGQNGKISNMNSLLAKGTVHHGPIKQKDCSGCHNTHGSSNFRMLRESFPQLFYAPYSDNNYKLCFMCHQKTIASEPNTETLTSFRNGDQNLHFVHVNKMIKGRTCRACHDAHATSNPKHVRDAVPFAKWQLPVGFKKTQSGGTCLPGCHQLFGYDRDTAVRNKPAAKQ